MTDGRLRLTLDDGKVYTFTHIKWSRSECVVTVVEPDGSTSLYSKIDWDRCLAQWARHAHR